MNAVAMPHYVKHPLAALGLFLALVIVGDRAVAYLLRQAMWSSESRYSRLYTGRAAADIAVIGNSRAVHGFHTPSMEQTLHKSVVNLSSNGLSIEVVNAIFQDYLDRDVFADGGAVSNKPLVILEISGVHFAPAALLDLKAFSERSPRMQQIMFREYPTTTRAGLVSRLFALNSEGFQRSLVYLGKSDQEHILQASMSEHLAEHAPEKEGNKFLETNSGRKFEAQNLAALTEIVQRATRDNVEIRLVIGPLWPGCRNKIEEWNTIVDKMRVAAGNVPIWDYSLALHDRHEFHDRWHTNKTGANDLLQILQRDHFFDPGATPPIELTQK